MLIGEFKDRSKEFCLEYDKIFLLSPSKDIGFDGDNFKSGIRITVEQLFNGLTVHVLVLLRNVSPFFIASISG